jgi:hypothetical protein
MPTPRTPSADPHRNRIRLRVLTVSLASSLLAGCYSYTPLASTTVVPRSDVRLVFTADGAKQLRDVAGFEMRQLDGAVVRALADSAILVKPATIITVDGDELPWRRAELLVPWRTVERSQQRVMDKRRTRGFAAVMGAVFTGVVYYALKSIASGGGSSLPPGGGAPE